MWKTLAEWKASRYPDPVAIRSLTVGGRCDYWIPAAELPARYADFRRTYRVDQLNISAQAPEHEKVLQGEVCRQPDLQLFWSRNLEPMRAALALDGRQSHGLAALQILRSSLCPNSLDWMMFLLDAYPGHVVEFSSFRRYWGTLPRFNTVFWEVRLY
jgi:hypothetical protein